MGASAKVTKIGPGSKSWRDSIRKKAKDLANGVDNGYLQLSKLLWEIHKIPIDNDPDKPSTYTAWGFKTFGEYVEVELGIQRRKAERLRNIGEMFDVLLVDTDPSLRKRLKKVGWSKLRELRRVFAVKSDPKFVLKWTERAEQLNYPQFLHAVGKYLDSVDNLSDGSHKEAKTKTEKASYGGKKANVPDDEDLPDLERTHTFHFLCFNEQIDNVREAMERAAELITAKGGEGEAAKKSQLLSLICMDFLATNDFGKPMDPKTRVKFLSKLESHLGVKLVAIDTKSKDIVHGKSAFAKAVKAMADS